MNITGKWQEIKTWLNTNNGHIALIILILIISNIASFSLGQQSIKESPVSQNQEIMDSDYSLADPETLPKGSLASAIYTSSNSPYNAQNGSNTTKSGEVVVQTNPTNQGSNTNIESPRYVASKNGRVYYFTWCTGAKRILEENRVYFNTAEEARTAGLKPSTACPDLD
jgi:hypothetical protein